MTGVRMTEEQYAAILARRNNAAMPREDAYAQRKEQKAARTKSKYNNHKVESEGEKFDSKAEYRYWQLLKSRERAGEISNLQRQVVFELAPPVVIGGRKRPALRYIADMTWEESGEKKIADVKGAVSEGYRIKRHLMKAVHGIEILEIRS